MSEIDPGKLADAVLQGDRRALARAITLIESSRAQDREPGNRLLEKLTPQAGNSIRVGISGVPGVGKSTFIEALGNHVIDQGHRVAVLAVDPSSALSGGSILGDKTRMETLAQKLEAFIRPSPAGQTLGGVARRTRETMLLVEAAGFDVVFVVTVGVGQSETAVAEMTDLFMLLLLPAGGDELQGIKRGIVELADLLVVNKADGELAAAAERAAGEYRGALGFLHARHAGWQVPVLTCSSLQDTGIATVWETIENFRETLTESGEIERTRARQAKAWLWSETSELLREHIRQDPEFARRLRELESAVADGRTSPRVAAHELVGALSKSGR